MRELQSREDDSIHSGRQLDRGLAREESVKSGILDILKKCPSLELEDSNEVDDLHVGFVCAVFLIGKHALIALAGELVDLALSLGIEPIIDEFTSHVGSEHAPKWVQEPVDKRSVECLHRGILFKFRPEAFFLVPVLVVGLSQTQQCPALVPEGSQQIALRQASRR